MEKDMKNQRIKEPDFVLQWGNRKRHRCVKIKSKDHSSTNSINNHNHLGNKLSSDSVGRKKLNGSTANTKKNSFFQSPHRGVNKNSEQQLNRRKLANHSPEKEDRCYTTRGSLVADESGKTLLESSHLKDEKVPAVWPRLVISLSNKEKEEDFMAFKGCKLPHRPKKRAKLIQRSVLLACPGTWLSELTQERYEVREKKASKKKPRGLKAMGSMESESE